MLVGAAAALAVAGPAQAACPAQPSSQVFFPWGGDTALYRPVAGSSFEAGAPGWTLTGAAAVVTDHSPWNLQGPNAHSLELPAGASATTPPVCVDSSTPTARLFGVTPVRMPLISGSSLKVEVLYGDPTRGGQSVKALGTLPDELAWDATRKVSLAKGQLNLKPDSTGNTYIRYRFTPLYGTTWRIDDVYVDPRLKY
jgi:hypothetical protein